MAGERTETPRCGNCAHWRRAREPYDHCIRVNVREGWKHLTYMPVTASEWCAEHEPKEGRADGG